MIHYSCDRCQQPIAQDALRYVVKMQIQAEWDDSSEESAVNDFDYSQSETEVDPDLVNDLDQIQEMLSQLNGDPLDDDHSDADPFGDQAYLKDESDGDEFRSELDAEPDAVMNLGLNDQTDSTSDQEFPEEILESMFRSHRFDLCSECFEKFQADPLSGEKVAKVRFSQN